MPGVWHGETGHVTGMIALLPSGWGDGKGSRAQGAVQGAEVKAAEIFEICLERYRGMREWLQVASGRIGAVKLDQPSGGYRWRPDRARAAEYVADFERAGERALGRPMWKGRLRLFRIYFCEGVEYRRAITLVGVPTGTFDWWTQEVKRTVGRELVRTGLFPPGRYFHPGK